MMRSYLKRLRKNEKGQGATEYILLLVVVVGLAFVFKDRIMSTVQSKVEQVGGQIEGFNANN